MRILLATPLYPPEVGGPATYARFLEEALPPAGIAVAVVPFSRIRALPSGIRHLAYLFLLLRHAHGANLIFAQDAFSVGVPAALAARILRLPLIIRLPGEYAWEQGVARFGVTDDMETFETKRYGWKLELIRSIQTWTVKQADAVIVPSDYFKRIVLGWGVSPHRVHRIYNAVSLPEEAEAPSELPPTPFMLSAGRLVGGKGFETLIDILPSLPTWQLVIVGDGPLRAFLEKRAHTSGVSDRVRFMGRVSPEAMRCWYEAATVFVLATRFESFSFQVAEALMSGTPVIASKVGGIPEILEDGEEGVLLDPHDADALREAVRSVAQEPDAWKKRTALGKERANRFLKEAILPELLAVIRATQGL